MAESLAGRQVEVNCVNSKTDEQTLALLFEHKKTLGFKTEVTEVKLNRDRQAALITFSNVEGMFQTFGFSWKRLWMILE